MSFLPVVLFTLGILVLIAAWRLGNPSNTSPELLAALKGIAGVKKDIGYIRSELQETGARLEEHEKRIEERKILGLKVEEQDLQRDQSSEHPWRAEQEPEPEFRNALQENTVQKDMSNLREVAAAGQALAAENAYPQKSASSVLPEKYRGIIQLHELGWSVLEIASHLAISQDAVNMVLKTYPRGGQQ